MNRPLPFNVSVMNAWRHISTTSYSFTVLCLVYIHNTITFTFFLFHVLFNVNTLTVFSIVFYQHVNVEVKFTLEQAIQVQMGSSCIAVLLL